MRRPTCDAYQSHSSVAIYLPSLRSDIQHGIEEIRSTPLLRGFQPCFAYRYTDNHPTKQQNQEPQNRTLFPSPRVAVIPIIRTTSDRESSTTFRSASTSHLGGVGVRRNAATQTVLIWSLPEVVNANHRHTRRSQPAKGSWKLLTRPPRPEPVKPVLVEVV